MLSNKKYRLTASLVSRLNEVLTEGKWIIGTNIKEQIIDLNYKEATRKVGSLNSIADLTFHISYYLAGVSNVLRGGTLDIKDKFSFNYEPIQNEEDWQQLINKFIMDCRDFVSLMKDFDETDLKAMFVKEEYGDYLRNVNGIIEHAYYHFGQIVLIKKLIRIDQF